jgi:hypothetical protein
MSHPKKPAPVAKYASTSADDAEGEDEEYAQFLPIKVKVVTKLEEVGNEYATGVNIGRIFSFVYDNTIALDANLKRACITAKEQFDVDISEDLAQFHLSTYYHTQKIRDVTLVLDPEFLVKDVQEIGADVAIHTLILSAGDKARPRTVALV